MKKIGIRELKEHLSRYMKQVQSGEAIIVTDRKKEIAVISPVDCESAEEKIFRVIKSNLASGSGGKPSGMKHRISSRGKSVSEAVIKDRR